MLLYEDYSPFASLRSRKFTIGKQSCLALEKFLNIAMKISLDSTSPELARLILESEYDTILHCEQISTEFVIDLQLIKEFAWHIHYDEDYYCYLLSTENLWGNSVLEYAARTFHQNLPENVKTKYDIISLIKYVPENMFRLDDY